MAEHTPVLQIALDEVNLGRALQYAKEAVAADGYITERERRMLGRLQAESGLDAVDAQRIEGDVLSTSPSAS